MEQLVMPVANDVWAINAGFIIGLHEPGPTGNPFPIGKGVGGVLDGQFSMPAVQNVYLAKIRFPPAEVEGFEDLGRAFIIQRPELRDLHKQTPSFPRCFLPRKKLEFAIRARQRVPAATEPDAPRNYAQVGRYRSTKYHSGYSAL